MLRPQTVIQFTLMLMMLCISEDLSAEAPEKLKIGFIGCLTDFAANYGTAVLEGAELAIKEINEKGTPIELIVEDDQSSAKNTAFAYEKLRSLDKIDGLIGGTWWANSIAAKTESDRTPFLSCQTLYNADFVKADTYYTLAGDLRSWVRVFKPLIRNKKFKTAVTIRFSSGFSDTISEEMKKIFSEEGRRYLGDVNYSTIQMAEVMTLVTRVKQIKPEVVYLDCQPSSFALFMKKLKDFNMPGITVLTHSAAADAIEKGLIKSSDIINPLYFTRRASSTPEFINRFRKHYGRTPVLDADLGYYAAYLMTEALQSKKGALSTMKGGNMAVDGISFNFDSNQVWNGIGQTVWTLGEGKVVPVKEDQ